MNQIHFHFYIVRRYDFEIVSNYNRISYFIIDDLFIIIMNYSVKSVETSLYRKLLSAGAQSEGIAIPCRSSLLPVLMKHQLGGDFSYEIFEPYPLESHQSEHEFVINDMN